MLFQHGRGLLKRKKEGLFLLFSAGSLMNLGINDLLALDAKLWSEHASTD